MRKQSSIVGGLILILVGALFLLLEAFPDLAALIALDRHWPLLIVAIGGFFALAALLSASALLIPGAVIAGIGAILYYQNLSGNWASWAFAWTLIPGFVGLGILLQGLLRPRGRGGRGEIRAGGRLLLISLVLFVLFGAFFNGLGGLDQFWPLLLIGAGLLLMWRSRAR